MKKSAIKALREQPVEDLRKQEGELREQMLKARVATALEGKRRGVAYRNARRQVARINTIISQKAKAK